MAKHSDSMARQALELPVFQNPDDLSRQHGVRDTGLESLPASAVRFNRAIRDKRMARPGPGRWVQYIFPDLRHVYVEANLRRAYLGEIPESQLTARVVIRPGALEYTNDLHALLMMQAVQVSGDLLDVVRTADVVGLYVQDPETRGKSFLGPRDQPVTREKAAAMSLAKEAAELTTRGRKQIRAQNFVFPEARRYPIHDLSHARNALARVAQHGSSAEKSRVRGAVYSRYPGLRD